MKKREIVERLIEVEKNYLETKRQVNELGKRIDDIDIQSQNDIRRDFLQAKIDELRAQKCECHTNTQKDDKNTVEVKQTAKKEHSETIITNQMFENEVEVFFGLNIDRYYVMNYKSTSNRPQYVNALILELRGILIDVTNNNIIDNTIISIIKSKLKSKGKHYNKVADRYANIKDALARNKKEQPELYANWTVVDKINSYKDKHIQWLIDTKGTIQSNNDLQEAYIDVICYCIMAYIWDKYNG